MTRFETSFQSKYLKLSQKSFHKIMLAIGLLKTMIVHPTGAWRGIDTLTKLSMIKSEIVE